MTATGRTFLLTIAGLCLLAGPACGDDSGLVASGPVLGSIPWDNAESLRYRVIEGDDVIGSAELSAFCDASTPQKCQFSQNFEFPDREIADEVEVSADSETLEPVSVVRTVDGPEGKREWDATYEEGQVTVHQSDEDDERTDTLTVPLSSYDTWTDLFLWRTLDFREGFEVKYLGVVTADFAKPDVITISLKVTGLEQIEVPAGSFSAWRLEIRTGGRTQKAWIADNDERTLVRYDNTELLFELED